MRKNGLNFSQKSKNFRRALRAEIFFFWDHFLSKGVRPEIILGEGYQTGKGQISPFRGGVRPFFFRGRVVFNTSKNLRFRGGVNRKFAF